MTNHPFQILLHGGPLNGVVHELWIEGSSWALPNRVALPVVGLDGKVEECYTVAWYSIRNRKGYFQWTENVEK